MFSEEIDIANARLRFANGCVANATASRVSLKTERRLRLFQDDAYVSVDLHQKVLTVIRKTGGMSADGMPQVDIQETSYDQGDALKAEIEAFLAAAAPGASRRSRGEDGLKALQRRADHHRAGRGLDGALRLARRPSRPGARPARGWKGRGCGVHFMSLECLPFSGPTGFDGFGETSGAYRGASYLVKLLANL